MNDDPLEELAPSNPEFEEMLQERRELIRAIDYWRASDRAEAADRVAEFSSLLAELEEEIRSKYETLQLTTESEKEEKGGQDVE